MTERRAQIPRSFTNKLRQLCQIGDATYDEDRLILTLFNEKKFFQLAEHLNWYSKSKLSHKLKRYGFHKFRLQDKTVYRIPVRENDKKLIKMFSENSRQIKSEISTISILMETIYREKQLMNNVF